MKKLAMHPLLLAASLLLTSAPALSEVSDSTQPRPALRLVELFTSHGCSSCPPADRLLGRMLEEDPALMALEYHVDYWDSLVHGSDGSWKDPFSNPEYTERQQAYQAAGLAGRNGVYTPQMIVNGRFAAVGSDTRRVRQALQQTVPAQLRIDMETLPSAGNGPEELSITIDADDAPQAALQGATVSLVRYIDSASTSITGGENNRKQLVNHHIVFDVTSLGSAAGQTPLHYRVAAPAAGEGCVVMVQDVTLNPLLAAAQCP
ncbi:DUF1223 domain-containing protein [Granulosicoccus sp. 3-233]|uniref:DUF1223 domain-containing protein n=1 Tax=Granulosicoccus sp. 3-233 TaxID=3417969 RepID=UPI003D333A1F